MSSSSNFLVNGYNSVCTRLSSTYFVQRLSAFATKILKIAQSALSYLSHAFQSLIEKIHPRKVKKVKIPAEAEVKPLIKRPEVTIPTKTSVTLNPLVRVSDCFFHVSTFLDGISIINLGLTNYAIYGLATKNKAWKHIFPDLNSSDSFGGVLFSITQQIAKAPVKALSNDEYLTYKSVKDLKAMGVVLLTLNRDFQNDEQKSENADYRGIAALKEKESGYALHVCPGGGNSDYELKDIQRLMKEAIVTLLKENIRITRICPNIGRHPGDTLKNFIAWQKAQLN